MELLTPLRLLARRRVMLVFGLLLALAAGAAASGKLAVGPLASPEQRSAIATAEIQVDNWRPLAADVRASSATIAEQAIMLAERLTADDARRLIARRAGVPFDDLRVLSSRTAIVGRPSAVARAAVDAASSAQSRYRLTVSSTAEAPIISVLAAAPDRTSAARIAAASGAAVKQLVDEAGATAHRAVQVKRLAAPRTATVVSGGAKPLLGVIVAPIVFVAWCWFIIAAGGVFRLWRTGTTDRPAVAP